MNKYEALEAVILSGQVSDAAVQEIMQRDEVFAAWLKKRAESRQGKINHG